MKTCQKCGTVQKDENRFCVGCGTKLEILGTEYVFCMTCLYNNPKGVDSCNSCGEPIRKGDLEIQNRLKKLESSLQNLERRINLQSLRIESLIQTISEGSEKSTPPVEETRPPIKVKAERTQPISQEKVVVTPQKFEFEPVEVPQQAEVVQEEEKKKILPPLLPPIVAKLIPATFFPVNEVKLRDDDSFEVVVERRSIFSRAINFFANQFQAVVASILLIGGFVLLANYIAPDQQGVQSISFGLIGVIAMLMAHVILEGKLRNLDLSGLKSREVGIFLLNFGMGLSLGVTWATSVSSVQRLFLVLVYLIIPAYLAVLHKSELTQSTVVGSILASGIVFATTGLPGIIAIGGIVPILVAFAYILYASKRQTSFYPSLMLLVGGPLIILSSPLASITIVLPSIGIVLSCLPIAYYLHKGSVEVLQLYLYSIYAFLLIWPITSYLLVSYMNLSNIQLYVIIDKLILFVGLAFIFHLSTSVMHDNYEGPEILREISRKVNYLVQTYVPVFGIGLQVIIWNGLPTYGDILRKRLAAEEYMLQILMPLLLMIIIFSAYFLVINRKKMVSDQRRLGAWLSLLAFDFSILVSSIYVSPHADFTHLASFIVVFTIIFTSTVPMIALGIYKAGSKWFETGRFVHLLSATTIANGLILVIFISEGIIAVGITISAYIIFIFAILFRAFSEFERKRLYLFSLVGNAITIIFGQLLRKYNKVEVVFLENLLIGFNIRSLGPFLSFSLFLIFSGFSFLVLSIALPKRTEAQVTLSDALRNPKQFLTFIEQKLVEYQETIFSLIINIVYISFLFTDGLVLTTTSSRFYVALITFAFSLVNAITIYNARGRHWSLIIPSYVSMISAAQYINNAQFSSIVSLSFATIYASGYLVSWIDIRKGRTDANLRVPLRDTLAWSAFVFFIFGVEMSAWSSIAIVSLMLLSSLAIFISRNEYAYLGIMPVIISPILSWVPTNYDQSWSADLNYYLSLTILFGHVVANSVTAFQAKSKEGGLLIDWITPSLWEDIRRYLPIAMALFLFRPESVFSVSVTHVWTLVLGLGLIFILEVTGFKTRKAVIVVPFYIFNLILNQDATTAFDAGIVTFTHSIIISYLILRCFLIKNKKKDELILGVFSVLSFVFITFRLSEFPDFVLFASIVTTVVLLIQSIRLHEENYVAFPISFLAISFTLFDLDNLKNTFGLDLTIFPYIILSVFFAIIALRGVLKPQSFGVSSISIAILSFVVPVQLNNLLGQGLLLMAMFIPLAILQMKRFEMISTILSQVSLTFFVGNLERVGFIPELAYFYFILHIVLFRINYGKEETYFGTNINWKSHALLLPIPAIFSIYMSSIEMQVFGLLLLGILSSVVDAAEDHGFIGITPLLFGLLSFVVVTASGLEPSYSHIVSFVSYAMVVPIIMSGISAFILKFVDGSDELLNKRKQYIVGFVTILLSIGVDDLWMMFIFGFPLSLYTFSMWNLEQSKEVEWVDVAVIGISPIIISVNNDPTLAILPVGILALNVILTFVQNLFANERTVFYRLLGLGASVVLNGAVFGNSDQLWTHLNTAMRPLLVNIFWIGLLFIWLFAINLHILSNKELIFDLSKKASSQIIAIFSNWVIFSAVMLSWGRINNITGLLFLLGSFSVVLMFISILVKTLMFRTSTESQLAYIGMALMIFASSVFSSIVRSKFQPLTIIPLATFEFITYLILLPNAIVFVPIVLRSIAHSKEEFPLDRRQMDIYLLFFVIITPILWINYLEVILSVMLVMTWTLVASAAKTDDGSFTAISSIIFFVEAILLGFGNTKLQMLSIAGINLSGVGIVLFICSVLMFAYIWKISFDHEDNYSHTIIYLMTTFFTIVSLGSMAGLDNSVGRMVFFNGAVFLSVTTMAYAVKFSKKRYEGLATLIIYGALLIGIPILLTLGGTGGLNILFTMFTFFVGGIGFLINVGLKNITRLIEKASFLKILAPVEAKSK